MNIPPFEGIKRWQLYVVAGAISAFVVAVGLIVLFTAKGWWPVVVDLVLCFTALASMLMLLALILAVVFFIRTLRELRAELTPVLDSLKATSTAVQATASTASNFGVKPAIRTASLVVGASEVASVVLGRGHARKRSEKRQRRRQEIERELASNDTVRQRPTTAELTTRETTARELTAGGGLNGTHER